MSMREHSDGASCYPEHRERLWPRADTPCLRAWKANDPYIMKYPVNNTSGQMRRYHRMTPAFIFFALIFGVVLLINYQERFVFRYADVYTKFALLSLLFFTPFVLYEINRFPIFVRGIADKYPTTWLRTWIVMPSIASVMVGIAITGPLGWVYAVAAWSGGPIHHVSATAIKVGTYSRRKGCDEFATLRFASVDKETCLDSLYPHSSMHTGQLLDVGIASFQFGFLIVSIASTDSAALVAHSDNARPIK